MNINSFNSVKNQHNYFSVESMADVAASPSKSTRSNDPIHDYDTSSSIKPAWQTEPFSICTELTFSSELNLFNKRLTQLAKSAAALFVDRYHQVVDKNNRDLLWPDYIFDYNHALHHCGLSDVYLDINDYYELYLDTMYHESVRLDELRRPAYSHESISSI